jgi:ribosomal protein S18 acetylase RimI-like enzyme
MHNAYIYRQVANLHAVALNRAFLSTLGVDVLSLIYECIDADPNSVLFIELNDKKVVGYVAGGNGMATVYKELLSRWPRLIYVLLPVVINPLKLIKIFEILCYSLKNERKTKNKNSIHSAELYSIAVIEVGRRSGIAQKLYLQLAEYFRQQGKEYFCIIAGDELYDAHKFYLKMGAVPLSQLEVHKGYSSTLYRQDLQ